MLEHVIGMKAKRSFINAPAGVDATPYAFAENNPVNHADPTGYFCVFGKNKKGGCRGSGVAKKAKRYIRSQLDKNSLAARLAGAGADLLVTSTCVVGVIGFTGGIGTPGSLACKAAGKLAGAGVKALAED